MAKKERMIVFAVGLVLLLVFTFTDLQISLAVANKPAWARVLEVVGEIPFTTLIIAACAMLFRFRTRKNTVLNVLGAVGSGALFALLELRGRDFVDAAAAHDPRAAGQGKGAAYLRVYLVRAGGDQPGVYGRAFFQRRDGGRPALPGNI